MSTGHVVLLLPDSRNPYMQLSAETAAKVADRLRLSLDIEFAEGDFTAQVRQVYGAIRSVPPPTILMVTPVQESALKTLSEQAVEAGIGWFWLSRSVGNETALRSKFPDVPVCIVTPDQSELGRIQARQVRALLPTGGQILYVQGRMTNQSSRLRAEGFRDVLRRPGVRIEVIGELDGNWSAQDAQQAVTRWLRVMRPTTLRPDAIVCQNDAMAGGVLDALTTLGAELADSALPRLPVLGADGLRAIGRHMVDAGLLAATIQVPTTTERALLLAQAFLERGERPPAQVVLTPEAYPDEQKMIRRWRRSA
jgi:ABC-type sugar transport system substrate-binding protein